jgi:signal transduction histidine kinase
MEDNGVGFDPGAPSAGAKQKKPFSMLRKQAEQLEGRIEIHTRNGVRIRVTWH